jgi:hypothetical protein
MAWETRNLRVWMRRHARAVATPGRPALIGCAKTALQVPSHVVFNGCVVAWQVMDALHRARRPAVVAFSKFYPIGRVNPERTWRAPQVTLLAGFCRPSRHESRGNPSRVLNEVLSCNSRPTSQRQGQPKTPGVMPRQSPRPGCTQLPVLSTLRQPRRGTHLFLRRRHPVHPLLHLGCTLLMSVRRS